MKTFITVVVIALAASSLPAREYHVSTTGLVTRIPVLHQSP